MEVVFFMNKLNAHTSALSHVQPYDIKAILS